MDETQALEAARAFAREVMAPNAAAWELERRQPVEAFREAAGRGLCGLIVPRDMGGVGCGVAAMARVMKAMASADLAFAFALVVHNNLAGALARGGSADQRRRWLPDMLAGRRIGAFLLTEPRGGSDAAAIETRAHRDGDGWRLEGEKAWVSNAAHAGLLSVYAQTDPAAGWRGIASFLVEADAPGVERLEPYKLLGGHALGAGGFRFHDVRLPVDAVFAAPGEAFKAAMLGIDLARVNVAAMCCGLLEDALERALERIAGRPAFGGVLADQQGLQWLLADVATDLEASRLLAYAAAAKLDAGEDPAASAAHAKKFATRAALKGVADCMQAMGAEGLRHDHPLARHLAGAKIAQYLDGATEIQNVVIARALLKGRPRLARSSASL
jgi:alkylation response protein AidB-like acyl-CoA dehydrogenase